MLKLLLQAHILAPTCSHSLPPCFMYSSFYLFIGRMSSHVKPDPAHPSPTKFTSDSPEDAATRPHVNFIALLDFYYLDKQSCDTSWHSSPYKTRRTLCASFCSDSGSWRNIDKNLITSEYESSYHHINNTFLWHKSRSRWIDRQQRRWTALNGSANRTAVRWKNMLLLLLSSSRVCLVYRKDSGFLFNLKMLQWLSDSCHWRQMSAATEQQCYNECISYKN